VNPFPLKLVLTANFCAVRTLVFVASSRRTFTLRRLCRVSVRTRTSLHAIALRYLRPCSSVVSDCRFHPVLGALCCSISFDQSSLLLGRTAIGPTSRWWTGEDSNLRSPQGAADLQSAGFSHSPTRPRKSVRHQTAFATTSCRQTIQEREGHSSENTKRTRVKRHQPVRFCFTDLLRSIPPRVRQWSWRRELNPRPSDYKSDALPAELRQRSQTDKE
jgi:hypothetical protein